jgi:hypothetical protein
MPLLIKNSLERIEILLRVSHTLSRLQTMSDSGGADVTGMWSLSQGCWRSLPLQASSVLTLGCFMLRLGHYGEPRLLRSCTVKHTLWNPFVKSCIATWLDLDLTFGK